MSAPVGPRRGRFPWLTGAAQVDWVTMNLPDYPEIIKKPMDLGTIRSRLSSGHYATLSGFADDVQLVWDNAKLFNGPDSWVTAATVAMERVWARKRDRLLRERRRRSVAGENAAASPHAVVEEPLTYEEKQKLRADMMQIPESQTEAIVEVVRGSTPVTAGAAIEIELEKLPTSTLRTLQRVVASILPKAPKATGGAARGRGAPAKKRKAPNAIAPAPTRRFASDSDSSSSGLDTDSSDDEVAPTPSVPQQASTMTPATADTSSPAPPAVEVVNADAWKVLEAAEEPSTAEATPVAEGNPDPLWADYQTMSAEAMQREKQR